MKIIHLRQKSFRQLKFCLKQFLPIVRRPLINLKLAFFILTVVGVQANVLAFSQEITLSKQNVPLEEILVEIRKQSGFMFLYNTELLESARPVTIEARNASLEEVLEQCFKNQPFTYELKENTILIKPLKTEDVGFRASPPIDIKGKVTDENNAPLPGVSIVIKGTTLGTTTDIDGFYTLSVPEREGAVLVFSYVGYLSEEVEVANQSTINIALLPNISTLQDLVVVGYGTQEKVKITGAVSQVSAEVFENRPISNVAQGLQGAIPNLNITFGDGELNRGGTFNLRGFTSVNGGGPLILIDGTPGDINLLSPEDIESVTVLKDAASAAVYGARAAFGVVLVTTRSAKSGKPQIRYTNNFGFGRPTRRPQVVKDPLRAAQIQNEAYRGFSGADAPGMPEVISYLEQRAEDPSLPELGVDPSGNFIRGASTDWYDEFYNDSAPFSKNFLSISGTEGNTGYYLSLGYQTQEGIFKVATDDYKRYSLRLKVDNQLSDWLNVYNNFEFSKGIYDAPNTIVSEGGYTVYRYLSLYANPYEAIRTANGNYTQAGMVTFGQLQDAGRRVENDQMLKNTLGVRTNFFNNRLRVNADYTVFVRQNRDDVQYNQLEYENRQDNITQWTNPDYYSSYFSESIHQIINLYTEYEQNIGDHHFKGLVGFNQELNQHNAFTSRRDDNISPDLGAINLTTGISQVGDRKYEWALRGVFGRINYDYKSRYLLEVNARYDGTSRFPKDSRFGFFPSVSAGWVVSEEEFLKPVFNDADFKLRASYGSLGNQLVSEYAYINTMDVYRINDILDGEQQLATRAPALTPFDLTWETASTLNVGADLSLFNNRLEAGFDWYNRETKDMLTKGRTLPAVLGANEPQQNAADLITKGWEFSLGWNDQIGSRHPFSYYLRVVVSDNKTEITRYDNPNKSLEDYYEGMELGEIWGYKTLGFFETDDEYETHADQSRVQSIIYTYSGDGHPMAGDIKFEDKNGDGVIDFGENTADNPGDMYKIGNTTPRYAYGVNLGFSWRNFSVDMFWQGIGKRDFWPGSEAAVFWGFYNRWNQPVMEHIDGNYWTPENTDAYFPRPRSYMALNEERSLGVTQTRYLQNAAYARLKNLTIGYSIPQPILERVRLSGARLYFAGGNLLEFTDISEAFDPEGISEDPDAGRVNGNGFIYPLQRTYTFGVEINF